ncbi:MAG: GreA/GreB family elongation factor [Candidatus Dormibacteria bacterium]
MGKSRNAAVPITAAGLAALKAELNDLLARRPEVVGRVASARSDGDLKENFAYHDAREELGMLDGRVQTIEGLVANAIVIQAGSSSGTIALGSRVVVRDEFGDATYTIVGPAEVDIPKGFISLESPLGAALMGAAVGDEITFTTPGGDRSAKIMSLEPTA